MARFLDNLSFYNSVASITSAFVFLVLIIKAPSMGVLLFMFITFILGILAVIFGLLAMFKYPKPRLKPIFGIICGVIITLLSMFFISQIRL